MEGTWGGRHGRITCEKRSCWKRTGSAARVIAADNNVAARQRIIEMRWDSVSPHPDCGRLPDQRACPDRFEREATEKRPSGISVFSSISAFFRHSDFVVRHSRTNWAAVRILQALPVCFGHPIHQPLPDQAGGARILGRAPDAAAIAVMVTEGARSLGDEHLLGVCFELRALG
jgi:hypothetical protein